MQRKDQIRALFSRHDSNKDGKIDVIELQLVLQELGNGIKVPTEVTHWLLGQADLSGDGVLSDMELARGISAWYRWLQKADPEGNTNLGAYIHVDGGLPAASQGSAWCTFQ